MIDGGRKGRREGGERDSDETNVSEVESLSKVEFDGGFAGDPNSSDVVVSESVTRAKREGERKAVERQRQRRESRSSSIFLVGRPKAPRRKSEEERLYALVPSRSDPVRRAGPVVPSVRRERETSSNESVDDGE